MIPIIVVVPLVITAFVLGALAVLAILMAAGPMGPRF